MAFIIGLLTLVMVLDCIILIFLVLIQLPKKEAGAGLAFGGSATDALFGAGSGTVLTKITKYAAGAFFVMAVILSLLQSNYHRRTTSAFQSKLEQSGPVPMPPTPTRAPAAAPQPASNAPATAVTNPLISTPLPEATNVSPTVVPAPTATNPAAPASAPK